MSATSIENTDYWFHENGEILPVETSHFTEVVKNPERFGYTRVQIEECYLRYNEPMWIEGKARAEIMNDLIRNHGWIRGKYKPSEDLWVIELRHCPNYLTEIITSRSATSAFFYFVE